MLTGRNSTTFEFSELNDLLDFLENEWIGVAQIYEGI